MKIALAQLNYIIGDFKGNAEKIIHTIHEARENRADLVVFSELAVCGYPPLDLLEHRSFIEKCQGSVRAITKETKDIAVIIGAPTLNTNSLGKNLFNSALFIHNGQIVKIIHKALLPTYDIFDEYRYFQPSQSFTVVNHLGTRLAITICEDLWFQLPLLTHFGRHKLYTVNPMEELMGLGCDLVINIAASPFAYNHDQIKSEVLTKHARRHKIPIFYVNQTGAHTEIIFDGGSRVVNAKGDVVARLASFREDLAFFESENLASSKSIEPEMDSEERRVTSIHDALVLGIHDYFEKMNFKTAIIGLSGGIDSAVTLVLAIKALGAENIRVLLMPSQYSSDHSVTDAVALAENLGVRYDTVPIKNIFNDFLRELAPIYKGTTPGLAEENIQARIRGTLLMAVSNKFGNLLLNTSNKSEVAVGYGTLYGDMSGSISILGDVYKTDVYKLAGYINRDREIIPQNIIIKPPSAELRPDQKDSDSLPDYEILDKILYHFIELRQSIKEIIDEGINEEIVNKTIKLVNLSEYKRFQTPPILRVSSKAFGAGRRMPLVARY
ncbi:MAG: NAD+ synthase [Deltaproteobacteria bacterium]|nr:NAD+ synthase [Deltaproteobacteria bacterium]